MSHQSARPSWQSSRIPNFALRLHHNHIIWYGPPPSSTASSNKGSHSLFLTCPNSSCASGAPQVDWKNTGREPEEAPNRLDKNEPIKYENRPETWKESFLTPYMFKYPMLQKTAQTLYNGLGVYRKQNDAIRNSKYWYMGCAERDIIERDFLYKGPRAPPEDLSRD
jgi:hypothetical protein